MSHVTTKKRLTPKGQPFSRTKLTQLVTRGVRDDGDANEYPSFHGGDVGACAFLCRDDGRYHENGYEQLHHACAHGYVDHAQMQAQQRTRLHQQQLQLSLLS